MKQRFTKLLAAFALLVFMMPSMAGWGQELNLSSMAWSTPIVDENFNSLTAAMATEKHNPGITNYTAMGEFNCVYNNNTANSYGIENNSTLNSNALKLLAGSGSPVITAISGKSFATKGAYTFKITKTSKCYVGLYNETISGTAYTKAKATAYLQNNAGELSICNGSGWVSVGSFTSADVLEICVIYNSTDESNVTYGDGVSLAAKSAHVYVNGACVMDDTTPKSFTIPGCGVQGFRVSPTPTSGNVAIIDDLKIYDALPTAASTDPSITISGDEISNNAVSFDWNSATNNVEYTASVAYNNMDTPTSSDAVVGVYTDATCQTVFSGDYFDADFGNDTETIEYAFYDDNPSDESRTVYMRVEVLGDEGYIPCNVIAITQAGKPLYTVTYDANGGTGTMTDINSPYEENATVTLLSNSFTAPEGKIWDSWLVKDASNNTLTVTNNQFTMPASDVTVSAQWVDDPNPLQYEWVLTDWTNLENGDIFVIVGNNSKAMANVTSGSNNPSAIDVTIQNGKITSSVTDNMKWNRAAVTGGYKLLPNGSTTTWLNNTSSTNLRISDGANNNVFTYTTYSNNNYLKTGDRYACIYNNNDWRAYTTSNVPSNATNTTFYRRQLVSTDPVIIASDVSIAYNVQSGTINYTIDNPVSDASIQAVVATGATITSFVLGEPGSNAVTFTCDANTSTTATHTATVTLNYVKNNQVLDTKNVTVTQAIAPLIYTTIPALFEAATSTSTPVTVSFGNWVVTGVNGNQSFVTDGTNGFIMYQKNHGFEVGDNLSGTVNCDLVLFSESAEITGLTSSSEGLTVAKDGSVTPVVTTIDALQAVNTGSVVTLKNLTYNGGNLIDENNNTIVYYTSLYDGTTLETGAKYNVTGVFVWFNSTRRILPRSAADIEQIFTKTINAYTSDGSGEEPANGWYLIASPLIESTAPTAINGLVADDGHYDLYRFNQNPTVTNEDYLEWENYKIHSNGFVLENGKGYLYASQASTTLYFDGACNNDDTKTVGLDYSTNNPDVNMRGWNLVGNPFTTVAYADHSYFVMDENGASIVAEPVSSSTAINPFTGVFVQATETGQSVIFSKTAPSTTNNKGVINLALSQQVNRGSAMVDKAVVSFNEGDQLGKFVFMESSAKLYIPKNGKDYAIAVAEGKGEMPVNFKAQENGTYTLNINTENVEMNYLHLIDNMTGMDVDLLQTPSYTFDATTNDYASRFRLVFSANGMNENGETETFAFYSNGNWVVGNEGEATLQVIDVNGRIVSNETINGTVATNINATPGVYMLRLVNGNEVKTQKIVVK